MHIDHHGKLSYGSQTNIVLGSAFALVVFGCTHCIAWNFAFPTEVEQMLWKISSIFTASAIPTAFAVNISLTTLMNRLNQGRVRAKTLLELWTSSILGIGFGVAFLAARAFIIFEVSRCLAFQPPETFLTSWPANLPHIN